MLRVRDLVFYKFKCQLEASGAIIPLIIGRISTNNLRIIRWIQRVAQPAMGREDVSKVRHQTYSCIAKESSEYIAIFRRAIQAKYA